MSQTGVTAKRLQQIEASLQAKMWSISKERYIEQMERTFQQFCARARQMFEQEFQQILKSQDTNLANQLYSNMKDDLQQIQASKKKLQFGEQLSFDQTIAIGMLMGRMQAREEELKKQIQEVQDQTQQVIIFDEAQLRRSIKTTVSTKKLMNHYKLYPIKKFVRFRDFIQSGGWGINKWDAIQIVAKKPIIISAFEAYRHRSDDRAYLRYKVNVDDDPWINQQRIELKDNVKSRHVTKIDLEPLGKAIVLDRGQSCHLMTMHQRSTRQVQHQQAYNGRNGAEYDDEDAFMIRKSKFDQNYTTLQSGQIPTIYYYTRKILDKNDGSLSTSSSSNQQQSSGVAGGNPSSSSSSSNQIVGGSGQN